MWQKAYIVIQNTGRREHGRPVWRVYENLIYCPSDLRLETVYVERDFETDLASVPRFLFFWRIASPMDAIEPSVIHDKLCREGFKPRAVADYAFLIAMKDYGVSWWRRNLMYLAVRAFGWTCYRRRTAVTEKDRI